MGRGPLITNAILKWENVMSKNHAEVVLEGEHQTFVVKIKQRRNSFVERELIKFQQQNQKNPKLYFCEFFKHLKKQVRCPDHVTFQEVIQA